MLYTDIVHRLVDTAGEGVEIRTQTLLQVVLGPSSEEHAMAD